MHRHKPLWLKVFLPLAALLFSACGNSPSTGGNTANFTLSLNPTTLTINQGGSGTTALTLTPQNGFTGTVSLSLEKQDGSPAPSGLTLSPTSVSVSGTGAVNQNLTLNLAASVATGTYSLRVKATAGGLTQTANFSLTVQAQNQPNFTLSLNPTTLTINQGGSGTTALTLTPQNGFTGTVSLSLEKQDGSPAPSGLTLSPTSVSVSGTGAVNQNLTVGVAASVAAGTYSLRVKATAGSLTQTANFSLTVQQNSGSGGSITLTVEDPMGSFYAAAYQVGTGSWQTLTMTTSGATKTATIQMNNQTRYGVAVRCDTTPTQVTVIQATSTELANPKVVCSSTTPSTPSTVSFTVNVSISGITVNNDDRVCVSYSCSPALSAGATSATATVTASLRPGSNRDLLVTLGQNYGHVKVAKVVRNVNVTNGGSAQANLTANDQLAPVSFTPPNLPAGYISGFTTPMGCISNSALAEVFYLSGNLTAVDPVIASASSYQPVSGFGGGDLYLTQSFACSTTVTPPITATLRNFQVFNSGAPTLTLPNPWPSGSLSVNQAAHPTVTGLSRTESDLRRYQIDFSVRGLGYTAILSKGWLGSATSYTLPDLSSQLGYTTPTNGSSASLEVDALLSDKVILELSFSTLLTGTGYARTAGASTSFTVGSTNNVSFP